MIEVTNAAAERLMNVANEKNKNNGERLRVFVKGGGCGGLQYGMTFDADTREGDTVDETQTPHVVVDAMSMPHIEGAVIDWQDTLMGGGFQIENPNAVSTCGCGSSFRTG